MQFFEKRGNEELDSMRGKPVLIFVDEEEALVRSGEIHPPTKVFYSPVYVSLRELINAREDGIKKILESYSTALDDAIREKKIYKINSKDEFNKLTTEHRYNCLTHLAEYSPNINISSATEENLGAVFAKNREVATIYKYQLLVDYIENIFNRHSC